MSTLSLIIKDKVDIDGDDLLFIDWSRNLQQLISVVYKDMFAKYVKLTHQYNVKNKLSATSGLEENISTGIEKKILNLSIDNELINSSIRINKSLVSN